MSSFYYNGSGREIPVYRLYEMSEGNNYGSRIGTIMKNEFYVYLKEASSGVNKIALMTPDGWSTHGCMFTPINYYHSQYPVFSRYHAGGGVLQMGGVTYNVFKLQKPATFYKGKTPIFNFNTSDAIAFERMRTRPQAGASYPYRVKIDAYRRNGRWYSTYDGWMDTGMGRGWTTVKSFRVQIKSVGKIFPPD